MRIEKLTLDKEITQTAGIEPINLERLGSVVSLVGRNGSGKSRILRLIESQYLPQINYLRLADGSITYLPEILLKELEQIKKVSGNNLYIEVALLQEKINRNPSNSNLKERLKENKKNLISLYHPNNRAAQLQSVAKIFNNFDKNIHQTIPRYFRKIDYSEILQLQQAIQESKSELPVEFEKLIESVTDQEDYNEFTTIYRTALTFLSKLPHQLVYDLDECYGDQKKFRARISYKRFSSLRGLIKDFLNKDLDWKKEKRDQTLTVNGVTAQSKGVWKLNGRNFNYSEFSEGEKTLFAYSLLFFLLEQNPNIRIRESIILIDEPELHLHPESELAVINGIRKVIREKGQLWIATHSINILSDLSYDEIYLVKDSAIIPPSRTTPGKSFNELMGLEEHIERLSHFITDISNWSFLNFINQCFNDPEVVKSARANDPEVELFKRSIKKKVNGTILLDFGAGKGRLFKEVSSDELDKSKLQYFALEPEEKNRVELEKLKFSGIFKTYTELPENIFDFILLCNVLHEIPVMEWITTLSTIISSLKEDGFIIIIEDMRLPKGEKIGETGFLILDVACLKELFSMSELPGQLLSNDGRYRDRMLCALVNKQKIGKLDVSTVIKSLETLQKNTFAKINKIRKAPVNEENKLVLGRESAYYSQLYINAILSIEKLKVSK